MSKKRILIFSTAYFPFVGGAEVAVREIAKRFNDVEFVLMTARMNKKVLPLENMGNVEIHRIGQGDKWDKFRLVLQGAKLAGNLGSFDAVWSIMASYAGFAALMYKKQHKDTKYVLTLQEGDTKAHIYKRVWFVWPLFKQIFTKADRIQAISKYLADWASDMGAKCPVEIVPNGVDLNIFLRNVDRNVEDIFANEKNKTVISVSRLVEKNGVADLISAMEFLPQNVRLLIAGSGELEDMLKSLVKEKKLQTRVNFLGTIDSVGIASYLKESDVFCRPSLSEGLGNVFLEAMASNVPIVATKVGGIPDFLSDGETGWFCETKNPQSIADKIKYILDEKNKTEVERVKKNALKMVEEKYNWDFVAEKMRRILL